MTTNSTARGFWDRIPSHLTGKRTVRRVSVITTWLYNAAGGRTLVAIVFHTLSNAVSVTTAGGVIGDEVASQVALLAVVWTVVAVLVWQYDTDRLSPNPLPDGGLDLTGSVTDARRDGETGGAPRATESE